jgi:radical SAM superfamily enzyme YgiQ (UPF0313 family)
MKIVFTHGYFLNDDAKEQAIMRPYSPLGILYLSSHLEKNGFSNSIFDTTFSSFDTLKEYLYAELPDIVAIYTNLMTKLNVLKILSYIKISDKLKHTKIILGGPEVKNHSSNFINAGADYVIVGEGEETMLELTKFLSGENIMLKEICGIVYRGENDLIVTNAERALIKNIDSLSFPNRSKINFQLYLDAWKNAHGMSTLSMSTMRGCPYTCNWCSRAVYGLSYRRRSPKLVVDEIIFLQQNYLFDSIWFVDDVFTISHKWLEEFATEIKMRNVSVKYECITRADRMNDSVVSLLKQSGCFRVWIGAESGSQKIIDAMDRRVKVEQVGSMIKLSQEAGMEAGTFIMLGYPGETEKDIAQTLHHLKKSNPDLYTITIAYPIKGTQLYAEVESNFVEKLDWNLSTDRDIDYKRTYKRKYYDYAVRWVYNEMALHKEKGKQHPNYFKYPYYMIKSFGSRLGMSFHR